MAPRQCGIHSKTQSLQQKTCIFLTFETLVAYIGMDLHMHALAHIHRSLSRIEPRDTLNIYFQKQIFSHLKNYIFHFNTSQVNLISNQALNWSQALEFDHHWGMRARVIKGTKCNVYSGVGFGPTPSSRKMRDVLRYTTTLPMS